MKNIPVFSTEYGVGSLILREIPYKGIAYVRIESSETPKEFVEECIRFCCMAGAEKIYAMGHEYLKSFPFHTSVLQMTCQKDSLEDTDAALIPVTQETIDKWLKIYNEKMMDVENAAFKTLADGQELLKRGDGYFVHKDELLLGIGIAGGNTVDAVISVIPGAGKDVLLALSHAIFDEKIILDVASTNARAISLYEKLGFIKTMERSKWYKLM